jgi:(2Fe-2S) ferredoxin
VVNGIGSHLTENLPGLYSPGSDAEETISKKKKLTKKIRNAANGSATGREKTKPAAKVRDYESHVFVCSGGDCKKRGARDTRKALKDRVRSEGVLGEVRIDTVDCLSLCKHGPNVVVYDGAQPKGTWYLGLDEDDVPKVVDQHLKNGEPVERLTADRRPRKAKKAKK